MTTTDVNEHEQDDDMNSGLGVAERELLQGMLHGLPDTPPPRAVWERVQAQAEAEGLFVDRRRSATPWYVGAGIAAAVLLVVLRLPVVEPPTDDGPFPTEPAYVEATDRGNLEALMVHSEMLERNLRALPAEPRVMRAGTAATIGQLETRIAAIDSVLNDHTVQLTQEQRETYWRERVRLMDSLVQVRYAQARRNSL